MPRRKNSPVPTFVPWADGDVVTVKRHDDDWKIAHIRPAGDGGWELRWTPDPAAQPPSTHDSVEAAVAAAVEQYPLYLVAEKRWLEEEHGYEDRFVRRQERNIASAIRIPTGGQRGWRPASDGERA